MMASRAIARRSLLANMNALYPSWQGVRDVVFLYYVWNEVLVRYMIGIAFRCFFFVMYIRVYDVTAYILSTPEARALLLSLTSKTPKCPVSNGKAMTTSVLAQTIRAACKVHSKIFRAKGRLRWLSKAYLNDRAWGDCEDAPGSVRWYTSLVGCGQV